MLMSYLDEEKYEKSHEFTVDQMSALTPADILRWINVRVFGVPDPPEDAKPRGARSNTLKYWKKALSFCMPYKLMQWTKLSNQGNPTESIEINKMLTDVKKKEARKQGAPPQARRSIKERAYCLLHSLLKESNNNMWRYAIPAIINFQLHLIARIDDTPQLRLDHLKIHN
jgi:hypothetical protein